MTWSEAIVPEFGSKGHGFTNGQDTKKRVVLFNICGDITHAEVRGAIKGDLYTDSCDEFTNGRLECLKQLAKPSAWADLVRRLKRSKNVDLPAPEGPMTDVQNETF